MFVAFAVGLGWGIRGHFGGPMGAMFPGAMLGLGFAYVSGQRSMFRWMPIVGAVSAWFISEGGNMTYGLLQAYACSGPPAPWYNSAYGFLMLIVQGGCWGIFGTAAIALLLEKKDIKLIDVVHMTGYVYLFGWLFSVIIIKWWGFHVNPPRSDSLVNHFGGAVGMVLWLVQTGRKYALRGALIGFVGFGLGMSLGRMNANILDSLNIAINSWNVMEISCGAIGGFLFTYFMAERSFTEPQLEKQLLRSASAAGAIYILGIIPLLQWFVTNKKDIEGMQSTLESWGYVNASAIADKMQTAIYITIVLGFVSGLIWIFLYFRDKKHCAWFPILSLGLTIMLIDLFARLYFYYPPPRLYYYSNPLTGIFFDMRTFTIGLYLLMALYVVLREWKYPHTPYQVPDEKTEKIPWKIWLASTICAYLFIMLVSCFTNPVLMDKTNAPRTRWPIWNKIDDGPFKESQSR